MWSSVVPAVPCTTSVELREIAAASSSASQLLPVPGSPISSRPRSEASVTMLRSTKLRSPNHFCGDLAVEPVGALGAEDEQADHPRATAATRTAWGRRRSTPASPAPRRTSPRRGRAASRRSCDGSPRRGSSSSSMHELADVAGEHRRAEVLEPLPEPRVDALLAGAVHRADRDELHPGAVHRLDAVEQRLRPVELVEVGDPDHRRCCAGRRSSGGPCAIATGPSLPPPSLVRSSTSNGSCTHGVRSSARVSYAIRCTSTLGSPAKIDARIVQFTIESTIEPDWSTTTISRAGVVRLRGVPVEQPVDVEPLVLGAPVGQVLPDGALEVEVAEHPLRRHRPVDRCPTLVCSHLGAQHLGDLVDEPADQRLGVRQRDAGEVVPCPAAAARSATCSASAVAASPGRPAPRAGASG